MVFDKKRHHICTVGKTTRKKQGMAKVQTQYLLLRSNGSKLNNKWQLTFS
jgi:hypothetical protein